MTVIILLAITVIWTKKYIAHKLLSNTHTHKLLFANELLHMKKIYNFLIRLFNLFNGSMAVD